MNKKIWFTHESDVTTSLVNVLRRARAGFSGNKDFNFRLLLTQSYNINILCMSYGLLLIIYSILWLNCNKWHQVSQGNKSLRVDLSYNVKITLFVLVSEVIFIKKILHNYINRISKCGQVSLSGGISALCCHSDNRKESLPGRCSHATACL